MSMDMKALKQAIGIGAMGFAGGGQVPPPKKEPKPVPSKAEGGPAEEDAPAHKIDADSMIDLFLDENPELAATPIEDWPEDALQLLQDTLNEEGIDDPNGALPEEEDPETGEPAISKEAMPVSDSGLPTSDEDNPAQDFDIFELAKLVQSGDKDQAWNMLQGMFGVTPDGADSPNEGASTPTNQLDRMLTSDKTLKTPVKPNPIAKLMRSFKY